MPTRKLRDIHSALARKGFQKKMGDHNFFIYHRLSDNKKTSVFTKTSHGSSEIGDSLLGKMATQCRLSKADFLDLIDCPLEREPYESKLRKQEIDV